MRFPNDQIEDSLASVSYASFEDSLVKLRQLGKSAFRLLPIHQNVLIF